MFFSTLPYPNNFQISELKCYGQWCQRLLPNQIEPTAEKFILYLQW